MLQAKSLLKIVAAALLPVVASGSSRPAAAPPTDGIRPGLEVLLTDHASLVLGRRVGLVTNQAGVDHAGVRGVDRLLGAGVRVVALFSPEHGFRGTADPGAPVTSTTDSATGLPIYSLYGANSAPSAAMLAGIDVMLVDLQDVGARYYTYLWTTVEVLRAAQRHRLPVVVLDRPNPIGGLVQGNVLDATYRSAVGLLAVPMRHGMTLGELARLARHDLGLKASLTVIPVRGWHRSMYFDETGLPFVAPSPNLRVLEALIHYPGLCLFEGTTLSVGRGTDHPFEQIGAPWLDTSATLLRLRAIRHPGVEFTAVTFTPNRPGDGKYADTLVPGLRLRVTDRRAYDPTTTALMLLAALDQSGRSGAASRLWPTSLAQITRLYGGDPAPLTWVEGGQLAALAAQWQDDRDRFLERRRPYLMYPE